MSPSLLLLLLPTTFAAGPVVRTEDTWDFTAVFPSVEAWSQAYQALATNLGKAKGCRGHVATKLQECLDLRFQSLESAMRINTYASNISNGDTRDSEWLARSQRAEALVAKVDEATAFLRPEIITMGASAVEAAISANPKLGPYDFYLRSTAKDAAHTLDASGEGLLASAAPILAAPERLQTVLVNAELPWPTITLTDGTQSRLQPSSYVALRASPNRADRKLVFDSFFGALHNYEGVLGGMLDTAVQAHWLNARVRDYDTSVAASIDYNHVPATVYQTLVARTNTNLPTLHRYLKLRGRMLGVDDLAYYDMYPPLVKVERTWTVDQARDVVIEATRPLGPEYTSQLQAGFRGRWMDVYPREGKVGGAYMDGATAGSVHPFLLLNFTGEYEAVSTMAHEWGHGLHSVLSARAQPYAKADYATFIAEIASTFNEALLMRYMLDNAKTDDERLFYLGNALEGLRTTYFRQAQFAEFELAIHTQVEKGEPLTGESLNKSFLELLKRYYGADTGVTRIDETYGVEWAYIPHFYYNFYVYQYATSIAAASLLSEEVLAKKPGALDRYLRLLKAGGSDDPYVLLKKAGVDMATAAPYDAIARRMNSIMDEMERIVAKRPTPKKK